MRKDITKKIIITILTMLSMTSIFIESLYLSIILSIGLIFLLYSIFTSKKSVEIVEVEKEVIKEKEVFIQSENLDPRGDNRPKTCHGCTEQIFFVKEALPLMKQLSLNTKEYEDRALSEIFSNFREIFNESDTIVTESESSMKTIFDPQGHNNLAYVTKTSNQILDDFTSFLPVLEDMKSDSNKFINSTIESFNNIEKTTKEIVELSEQVKVISINVRIEAARVKDSGGFNVLGNDISSIADKTSLVASRAQDKISDTVQEVEQLKSQLINKITLVKEMADNIYSKISPFDNILSESSDSVHDVIDKLNSVSDSLNLNLNRIISKLQYQDITSQESKHIMSFISEIEEMNLLNRDYELYIDESEKQKIRKRMIDFLQGINPTQNEHKIINQYSKSVGIDTEQQVKQSEEITLF